MLRYSLALVAALFAPAAAVADPCEGDTTYEMGTCAAQGFEREDKRLNAAYVELRTLASAEEATELRTAQRAWIRFRDADCAWVASAFRGGTFEPVANVSCRERATRRRAEALEDRLVELRDR